MKSFAIGQIVTLNEKVWPMHEHKGWLITGRKAKILGVASENKRRGNRWYLVQLMGKSGNVIGRTKVPSNWMDA